MIYFAQIQSTPYLIKIGFTQEDNLFLRIKALKSESKNEVLLLITLKGDRAEEVVFHSKFEDLCVNGEWFFPSRQLLKFISKHIDSNRLQLLKKNDFHNLIDLESSITKDSRNLIEELRNKNRNIEKEANDLYKESKRLLSENIKLEAELRKYKPETRDINS